MGANVTLSDACHFPQVQDVALKNCDLNHTGCVPFKAITWGQLDPDLMTLHPVDLIIASDCFYNSSGTCIAD